MVSKITLMRIRTLLTGVFDIDYVNPFFDAAIDVVFTSPSKKQIRIGGFHYGSSSGTKIHTSTMQTDKGERQQVVYDFDQQDLWKARFAPREFGQWKYNFVFRNVKGQEAFGEGTFTCVNPVRSKLAASTCVKGRKPNPGFVRRHPTNPFRFVFDDVDRWGAYVDFWEFLNEQKADDHWYQRENELESDIVTASRAKNWKKYNKPVVVGEQGNHIDRRKPRPPGVGGVWDEGSALRMRIRNWTA